MELVLSDDETIKSDGNHRDENDAGINGDTQSESSPEVTQHQDMMELIKGS